MCPIYEKPTEGNKYFFWWNIPCFIPWEGKQTCTRERLMYLMGPLQHQRWSQLIETFTVLQVFLYHRNFLERGKKRKDLLVIFQTISQSCAKHRYWKAGSYSCRFLCWDTVKDLARMVMPNHSSHPWQLQGALVTAICQLFPLRRPAALPFSQRDTYRFPVAGVDNSHGFPWDPLLQLCCFLVDRLLYLQAAPSGSLYPCTTGGLAWETPSSQHSSR